MAEVRDALERLAREAPAPSPDFRDRLWEGVAVSEARARRRRRPLIVAVVAFVAAGSAASVFALGRGGQVVDKTFSCKVDNFYRSQFDATFDPKAGSGSSARLQGHDFLLSYFTDPKSGRPQFQWPTEQQGCRPVSQTVAFSAQGLRVMPLQTFHNQVSGGTFRGFEFQCTTSVQVRIRAKISLDSHGRPTTSSVVVWNARKHVPIALFEMLKPPGRAWAAKGCG